MKSAVSPPQDVPAPSILPPEKSVNICKLPQVLFTETALPLIGVWFRYPNGDRPYLYKPQAIAALAKHTLALSTLLRAPGATLMLKKEPEVIASFEITSDDQLLLAPFVDLSSSSSPNLENDIVLDVKCDNIPLGRICYTSRSESHFTLPLTQEVYDHGPDTLRSSLPNSMNSSRASLSSMGSFGFDLPVSPSNGPSDSVGPVSPCSCDESNKSASDSPTQPACTSAAEPAQMVSSPGDDLSSPPQVTTTLPEAALETQPSPREQDDTAAVKAFAVDRTETVQVEKNTPCLDACEPAQATASISNETTTLSMGIRVDSQELKCKSPSEEKQSDDLLCTKLQQLSLVATDSHAKTEVAVNPSSCSTAAVPTSTADQGTQARTGSIRALRRNLPGMLVQLVATSCRCFRELNMRVPAIQARRSEVGVLFGLRHEVLS